jgi:hypothetical protein
MPQQTGNEASHWSGGLSGISHLIMQRPQMAAMARQRALQMQLNQQRGNLYDSQSAEHQQKAQVLAEQLRSLKLTNDQREKLIPLSQAAAKAVQEGRMKDPAIAEWRGTLADIVSANKSNPAVNALAAIGETSPDAELKSDTTLKSTDKTVAGRLAVAGANNAAKSKLAKDTAADRQKLEETRLAGRQGSYDQTVETFDPVTAEPAVEASSGFLGIGAHPAKAAVQARGKITHTTRTPHNAWGNTQNLPAAPAAPAPSTGINEGLEPIAPAPVETPAPQAEAAPAQDAAHGYQPGQIYPHPTLGNIKFIGGDPNDEKSWQKAD